MTSPDDTQRIIMPTTAPARQWPHLIVIGGDSLGQIFRLFQPETIIGRDPDADIYLPSGTVSRRHARLILSAGDLTVQDLGSRNGTFVEMEQVKQPRVLRDGDELAIGDSTLLKVTHEIALDEAIGRNAFDSARRDPSTLVSNTHYFLDRLRAEQAYSVRHQEPLTLVFLRVANIVGGGTATPGTEADMRRAGKIVRQAVRTEDLVARSDADQFVALLRSDDVQARGMAERMCTRVPERTADGSASLLLTAVVIPLSAAKPAAPETILVAARQAASAAQQREGTVIVQLPPLRIDHPHAGSAEADRT